MAWRLINSVAVFTLKFLLFELSNTYTGTEQASLLLTALHYSKWRHRGGSVSRLAGQATGNRCGVGERDT